MTADNFQECVEAYRRFLGELGAEVSALRSEVHVESICDWSQVGDLDELKQWFEAQRESCSMTLEEIPLNQARGWTVDPQTGNVAHDSGEFFAVHGLRVGHTSDREAGSGGWDQPILTQTGYDGGLLGILRKRINGVPHYLIEAKAEPGNYKKVQLSPTLQATFSNLMQAHAGRKPHFADLFEDPDTSGARVLYSKWLSEDGGRLHLKRNRGMLVEVAENTELQLPATFRWMSMWQIKECLLLDAWVNPHIRGIIAHI